MKRVFVTLILTLAAAFALAACTSSNPSTPSVSPATIVAPTPTPVLPTATRPTAAASPTVRAEPAVPPTQTPFPGKAVSFDQLSLVIPAGVAAGGKGTRVAEAKGDAVAPWDVAPEHIRFALEEYALQGKLHQPVIYAFPAQAYAELQERGAAAQSLERLRAVLAQSGMVNVKELPQVPFFNVPQALAAQVKVISFRNGRGVRMLTEYAMARATINNHELIYHFEGLTNDGRTYVVAILPVTAPGLPEESQPGAKVPPGGVPIPDFNDINANWMGYYGDVRQMLQGLASGAYAPNLDQLDALIGSLSLTAQD